MRFRDRADAGRILAGALQRYKDRPEVAVLALPRGGVPVGYEVAKGLNAQLDVFIVRKLGVPGHEELAMGAIASGGMRSLNPTVIQQLNLPQSAIDRVAAREGKELERREQLYRGDRPPPIISGRILILVDDGLATGCSMKVAVEAVRRYNPARIVVAVPTAPRETLEALQREADEVICAVTPEPFYAVGLSYDDFAQTTDSEVTDLLNRSAA